MKGVDVNKLINVVEFCEENRKFVFRIWVIMECLFYFQFVNCL